MTIMAEEARPLTPLDNRKSPQWPAVQKDKKPLKCEDCERSLCVCDVHSSASISLCSEDEYRGSSSQSEWSIISDEEDEQTEPLEEKPFQTTPMPPPAGHLPRQPPIFIEDRSVFIEEFRGSYSASARPELSVYSTRARNDVNIPPQCSVNVETDIIIFPSPPTRTPTAQDPAITFCPLSPNSTNHVEGTRMATIVGGAVSTAAGADSKRLTIVCGNPSAFTEIFFPKGSMLGVLEIFPHRY